MNFEGLKLDIRHLTSEFAVSPQIEPADLSVIAEAGFRHVICNRPDSENPAALQFAAMAPAAEAAGLTLSYHPITHQGLTAEIIAAQKSAMSKLDGPILAYCASGTRSSIVWSYANAGEIPTDDIILATTNAGYSLGGMRPALDQIAAANN